jgi:transposase
MDVDHGLEMNLSRREIRMILLHEFRLGHKATNNICNRMGKNVLPISTAQHWFNRFKNSNFELEDLPRSGRALDVNMTLLKQLIEEDPQLTTRCLAQQLRYSHTAVERHLNELVKTWRYGV